MIIIIKSSQEQEHDCKLILQAAGVAVAVVALPCTCYQPQAARLARVLLAVDQQC